MRPATARASSAAGRKLLVIDGHRRISHRLCRDLPLLLRAGDLIVANDAATLPASLPGTHIRTQGAVEVRLAASPSLASRAVRRFTAIVFGAGDFRTPTEHRAQPPDLHVGDELSFATLRATVTAVGTHPRLVDIEFHDSATKIWEGLARDGRPIQYAYVQEPLPVWDTWTSLAARPVAFEAPSAGFVLDWQMLGAIRAQGVRFAAITHAAGISSTGEPALDALLPFDEPYWIPPATAALVQHTSAGGGRVLAIGTTVVRALEHCVHNRGQILSGGGVATGRVGGDSVLRIVDGIVSGVHEPGSSHYELLRAFHDDETLHRMTVEAEAHDYLTHEFGDIVLMLNDGRRGVQRTAA